MIIFCFRLHATETMAEQLDYLYDCQMQDVPTKSDGDGSDGRGCRACDKLQDHPKCGQARSTGEYLLLQSHEQPCKTMAMGSSD